MKMNLLGFVLFLVGVGVVFGGDVDLEKVKKEAYGTIQKHLSENYGVGPTHGDNHCDEYPCCFLDNATDGCALNNMPATPSTLVFPGGKTRCIYSYSSDYAFQVFPGDTDKLLIYFQGGGACWDASSTYSDLCTGSIEPQKMIGVFERNNPTNKFSNYTIVHILYCSGDVHVGNVTREYKDRHGGDVIQRGQSNVVAVWDWIVQQQTQGNLDQTLTDMVLMGQSAGSVGVQSWAGEFLRFMQYDKASVVPDSYIGVFPPGTEGPLIYDYGVCNIANVTGLDVPADFYEKCMNQEMSLTYAVEYWLQTYPNIDFSYLQSKGDAVQIAFYAALALSNGKNPVLTQGEFYHRANEIMEVYNQYPNFVAYLVDGSQHTFTPLHEYYTAGPKGPREGNTTGDAGIMIDDWVPLHPLSPGDQITTICQGKAKENGEEEEEREKGKKITTGPKYCDQELVDKVYIQA